MKPLFKKFIIPIYFNLVRDCRGVLVFSHVQIGDYTDCYHSNLFDRCMGCLWFSINMITLIALVLCIGLVVDDAIVVWRIFIAMFRMACHKKQQ